MNLMNFEVFVYSKAQSEHTMQGSKIKVRIGSGIVEYFYQ